MNRGIQNVLAGTGLISGFIGWVLVWILRVLGFVGLAGDVEDTMSIIDKIGESTISWPGIWCVFFILSLLSLIYINTEAIKKTIKSKKEKRKFDISVFDFVGPLADHIKSRSWQDKDLDECVFLVFNAAANGKISIGGRRDMSSPVHKIPKRVLRKFVKMHIGKGRMSIPFTECKEMNFSDYYTDIRINRSEVCAYWNISDHQL